MLLILAFQFSTLHVTLEWNDQPAAGGPVLFDSLSILVTTERQTLSCTVQLRNAYANILSLQPVWDSSWSAVGLQPPFLAGKAFCLSETGHPAANCDRTATQSAASARQDGPAGQNWGLELHH